MIKSKESSRLDCCSGYMFNKTQKRCVECPSGYHGLHCNESCPFPSFGVFCRLRCTCKIHQCNNINGCLLGTSTDMTFFQTSASNTPQSASKNTTKTITRSSDSYFNTNESIFTKTPPLVLNPKKEDQKTLIKVSIFILGVVCTFLLVLYVASYAIKSNGNQVNTFTIEIEEREFDLN